MEVAEGSRSPPRESENHSPLTESVVVLLTFVLETRYYSTQVYDRMENAQHLETSFNKFEILGVFPVDSFPLIYPHGPEHFTHYT